MLDLPREPRFDRKVSCPLRDHRSARQGRNGRGRERELKVTLLDTAPKARKTDPKAYALHLQAVQLSRKRTAEGYAQSDSLYHQVLAIDPSYAPSWVNLASNLVNEVYIGLRSADKGFRPPGRPRKRRSRSTPGRHKHTLAWAASPSPKASSRTPPRISSEPSNSIRRLRSSWETAPPCSSRWEGLTKRSRSFAPCSVSVRAIAAHGSCSERPCSKNVTPKQRWRNLNRRHTRRSA